MSNAHPTAPIGLQSRRRANRRSVTFAALVAVSITFLGSIVSHQAQAAAVLSIEPIAWDVVGLDSNDVTDGPDMFPVGARVCNVGDTAATNVTATMVWDTASSFFTVEGSPVVAFDDLAAGDCVDAYFNVELTRDSNAYDEARGYHIEATADGLGAVATPTGRQLYIERLVSQNRNSVEAITGPGGLGDPAPATVVVGQTYTYQLFGSTATQGYEQLEAFIDFPNTIFRVVSVDTTYSSPAGATNDKIHADACGFDFDPLSPTYLECVGPENYPGGKAGGDLVATYVVEILSAGTATVASMIYDFSGSSFHYNSDYGLGVNSLEITAIDASADVSIAKIDSADPVPAGDTFTYRLDVANAGPTDATGVAVTDTLPAGVGFVSATGTGWSCSEASGTVTCDRATLASGSTSSITITVTAPAVGGTIGNTAVVTTTSDDPVPGNNTASEDTDVLGVADLAITKVDATDPVIEGDTVEYMLTATNAGPSEAFDVRVEDLLPPGSTFLSAAPSQGSCTPTGGSVGCDIGDLASGASATVSVQVVADAPGTLSNTATVDSATTDPDTTDNQTTETTTVTASADLTINKTDVADPVVVGSDDVNYQVTVANAGPSDAADVVVTDTLPAGVTLVSATPTQGSCSEAAGVVTCALGSLADGANASISLIVTPTAAGSLSNTATVTSSTGDPAPGDETADETTTVVESADLRITKTDSPDPVTVGNPLTYAVVVDNLGPSSATGVTIVDTLPGTVTYVSSAPSQGSCSETSGVVTCDLGTLASGSSATVTIGVTPTVAGVILNTATISADQPDPTPGNNADEATTVSPPATTDLTISKIDDVDPVGIGQNVSYTLTVDNVSAVDATGVVVTDTLPPYTSFVSATPDQGTCSEAGGVVTCDVGTITAADAPVDIVVVVTAEPGGEGLTVTNSATVDAEQDDAAPGDNSTAETTTLEPRADLAVIKTDAVDPVLLGEPIAYRVDVTNLGPSDAAGTVVTDTLPAGVSFVSAVPTQGTCAEAAGVVTCTVGNVANGDTVAIAIVVTPTASGSRTNTAAATTATTDTNLANDTDDESTTVNDAIDLSVTKADDVDPVQVGSAVDYTVTVGNAGPSTATGVTVTDLLPPGVAIDTVTPSQGSCSTAGGIVTCGLGTIAAGGSADVVATVTPGPSAAGTIANTVTVSADQIDTDPSDDLATETTTVAELADVSLFKTNGAGTVVAGTDTTYTVTLTNTGPSTMPAGVIVTDTVPAGTTATTTEPTCTIGTGTVTCTTATPLASAASTSWDIMISVPADHTATSITNTATVTTTPIPDPNPGNDTATDTDTVDRSADVSLFKTNGAGTVVAGTDTTYTVTLTNTGPSTMPAGVIVTDTVPAGTTATTTEPTCTIGTGTVTCTTATPLASAASTSWDITISVPADHTATSITNTATVTTTPIPDPNPGNDTATDTDTIDRSADVSLFKTGPATAASGADVTYSLVVSNGGPSEATGVMVNDSLPGGTTFIDASSGCAESAGVVTCSIGDLAVGASATVEIVARTIAESTGTITNTAGAHLDHPDPDPSNNADSVDTELAPQADLSVGKVASAATVAAGDEITYTIEVHNDGPSSATGVIATDTLPPDVTFVAATNGCDHAGGIVTCALPDLGPDERASIDVTVATAPGATATQVNDVSVVSDVDDPDLSNNESSVAVGIVGPAGLSIAKSGPASALAPGDSATYRLDVANTGPGDANGVIVTDDLPPTLTFISASAGCIHAAGAVTCDVGNLAAGTTASITIVTRIADDAPNGTIVNTVSVTGDTVDGSSADATASVSTSVVRPGRIPSAGSEVGLLLLLGVVAAGLGSILVIAERWRPIASRARR